MVTAAPIPDARASVTRRSTIVTDYLELFKPRVTLMVIITAAAGFYLGSLRSGISPLNLQFVWAMVGMAIVTAGSSTLNQVLERRTDALMPRTQSRPMAAKRLSLAHGLVIGLLCIALGSVLLAVTTNLITSMLTLLTAIGYVAIYTPLKRMSMAATFVGAFPGALPPLIGWTAARGFIEWPAVALFAILFVWQFPHFEAIGWLYRADYARAGILVTAVAKPDGRATAAQALFYAVLMIPASLWPVWLGTSGWAYGAAAIILGLVYLYTTLRFTRITRDLPPAESRKIARDLLKVSVIYLPLLLAAMMLNAHGRIFF
ncbi:protoheme IX farnesyltransferase [Terriglobus roseus DSM 18391]|uniref:Protoheme IX farnesyltransferase n=1 Tax=Terriglobus roseus (strain DSM 18391 / NRRL B-41598 / KBS 63) TaxID=926566 RepID=I3ZDR4_TERRK|nr:heme o synthase [Terriglobus roseus]AFL87382.1 protoheme IX farnesyltransferase [Terriglobus roseus DSM 18391]